MEGKGSFFILLVIIAILTLTLAVAVGYLFIVGGNPQKTVTITTEQIIKEPKDEELTSVSLFDNHVFNLKSSDNSKMSFVSASAELRYFSEIKGFKGKTTDKIKFHLAEIQQIVNIYFRGLTLDEAKLTTAESKANEVLTKQINEFLSKNEKQKYNFVYKIVFSNWNYQ